ncbi:N-acetyltransferase [Aureibaculum marinum]|uniref:N-acetyltransferase n=1 Tax=Aureibaculum marinum TaxID=2487930 RepID=A0A3N4P137_9FLAO|nr:GNAT family N-acetyltransferase [Aureibaculum marinum]RPE00858.1 N-acetyltransferase [Aureibaculum marinum]
MEILFTTERVFVRWLKFDDFEAFNKMQSSAIVMKYVSQKPMTYQQNKEDLQNLILSYQDLNNDFLIYAVVKKDNSEFIGTVALVKDENNNDEIGYRFLEEFWGKGYGSEVLKGLIYYCKSIQIKRIVANVAVENMASVKMIQNAGFQFVKSFISEDLKLPERKYILELC